jgi:hypothetical protein
MSGKASGQGRSKAPRRRPGESKRGGQGRVIRQKLKGRRATLHQRAEDLRGGREVRRDDRRKSDRRLRQGRDLVDENPIGDRRDQPIRVVVRRGGSRPLAAVMGESEAGGRHQFSSILILVAELIGLKPGEQKNDSQRKNFSHSLDSILTQPDAKNKVFLKTCL